MKRIFQPDLMRGHIAQTAAVMLWVALFAVLVVSVVRGIEQL
jgi:hypothetical protein